MRILVIGGAGIIGSAIVDGALRAGYEVYAVTRHAHEMAGVHYIVGDWHDESFAARVMAAHYDAVVDGVVFDTAFLQRELRLMAGHTEHFLYVSSAGVYNTPATYITEEAPIALDGIHWELMRKKRLAEIYLLEHGAAAPFMTTIIRPSVTYGASRVPLSIVSRRNQWTLIERILTGRPLVFTADGGSLHPIMPAAMFGDAVVRLLGDARVDGQAVHFAADRGYTWDEIAYALGLEVELVWR